MSASFLKHYVPGQPSCELRAIIFRPILPGEETEFAQVVSLPMLEAKLPSPSLQEQYQNERAVRGA